jgi:putative drug exporter of the RND superfamily
MIDRSFAALGRGVVRYRWVVIAIWIIGTIVAVRALPSLGSQVNNDNSAFLPASAPSNQAANLAEPLIGSVNQIQVPVVIVTSAPSLTSQDKAAVQGTSSSLKAVQTVKHVQFLGYSPDGRAAQLLVQSSVSPFDQNGSKTLVDDINHALAHVSHPANLQLYVAGTVATNVANNAQSNATARLTQLLSVLFIIILLLLIFRAVLAPLVTLLPAFLVLQLAGAFIGALGSHGLKISSITQELLIVLILGAGTDYGLFLVFRVREEMLAGRDPKEAVALSVQRVGESISGSASTVIVALLSLLLASFGIYHDLGAPLAIGIAVMLLAGVTLLPALLAVLGRAVFWPSNTEAREHREGWWGQIAGRLVRRPGLTLTIGVVIFGALAVAVVGFKPGGFGGTLSAPPGSDAAKGNAALAAHFPKASGNPTNLVMRFSAPVWQDASVLVRATGDLSATGHFTTLSGPLDPNGRPISPTQLTSLYHQVGPPQSLLENGQAPTSVSAPPGVSPALFDAYVATALYISADGRTVQWEAGLKAGDPSTTAALNAVPSIRAAVTSVAHRVGASASGVAGEAPGLYDVSSISNSDLIKIIPVAVLAIGIVLALVLRSLVAPVYLILSVVLSYLASLGLAVILFIEIGGSDGILFLLPFLMFIFLLALGEDYNILVMTRIREESLRRPLREAVVRAVGATGPTVTSAGLVLAGTFATIAIATASSPESSQFVPIGVGLAVGILLDTFFVRTVLVPSTVALLGRWNWWPSPLSRRTADALGGEGPPGGPDGPRPSPEPSPPTAPSEDVGHVRTRAEVPVSGRHRPARLGQRGRRQT